VKQEVGPRKRSGATRNTEGGPSAYRFREPPTLPETEIAVVRVDGVTSKQPQQMPPLVNLVSRCVQIRLVLLLAVPDGVRNEPNPRKQRSRPGRKSPTAPGKIAGDDPVCRRQVRADSKRHIRILELIQRRLPSKTVQVEVARPPPPCTDSASTYQPSSAAVAIRPPMPMCSGRSDAASLPTSASIISVSPVELRAREGPVGTRVEMALGGLSDKVGQGEDRLA
jgi:hypothetical protein